MRNLCNNHWRVRQSSGTQQVMDTEHRKKSLSLACLNRILPHQNVHFPVCCFCCHTALVEYPTTFRGPVMIAWANRVSSQHLRLEFENCGYGCLALQPISWSAVLGTEYTSVGSRGPRMCFVRWLIMTLWLLYKDPREGRPSRGSALPGGFSAWWALRNWYPVKRPGPGDTCWNGISSIKWLDIP